jgi:PAS domain S-box-containing protein
MHWTPYLLIPLASGTLSVGIAIYSWRHWRAPIVTWFAVAVLAQAGWSLGYMFEIASADLNAKIFWDNVQFLGMDIAPAAMLAFALQYAGLRKWLTRWTYILLAIHPVVDFCLVWTNGLHGLVRQNPVLITRGGLTVLSYEYGFWFSVSIAYLYMLVLFAIGLLIGKAIRSRRLYRQQIGVIVVGVIIPWGGTALTVLGRLPLPIPNLDISPVTFILGALVWIWGARRYRIFDVMPITRHVVIESASDGVVVLDAQNRVLDVNPAAQDMMGIAADQAVGQPVAQVLGLDEAGLVEGLSGLTEIAVGQKPEQRYYSLRFSSLGDERESLTGQLLLLRDITERKQAEVELRESEERYRTLVDLLPDAVIHFDLNGKSVLCNQQAVTLYGGEQVEGIIGRNVTDFVVPEELLKVIKAGRQAVATGSSRSVECTLLRKSGERYPGEVNLSVIVDSEGRPTGFIGIARDITERKRAEEEIRQLNAQLELRVTERTGQLTRTNRQLEQEIAERLRAEQALSWEAAGNAVVAEISSALLRSASMAEIAARVLESAQSLTGSAFGFTGYMDAQASFLTCPTHPQEIWEPYRIPTEVDAFNTCEGPWGWALENRQPMFTNVPESDSRVMDRLQGPFPIRRFLAVPALFGETLVGLLALANSERDYSERDLALIERLAALYALAIQRKRAEEALQDSEQRYRNLFESAPLCMFEVDMRRIPPIILRANRQAGKVYGWSPQEFPTVPIEQVMPVHVLGDLQRLLDTARRGETIVLESVNLRRDGSAFPVRIGVTQETTFGFSRGVITVEDMTAEKQRRSEEEAIAEERRRIAREIHDGVAQDLASLRFRAKLWHRLVDRDPPQMHAELDALRDLLSKNIREVRRSIFALRPVTLEELGFYPALQQFINDFGEQNQLHVDLRIAGPPDRLPSALEPVLFRITQEALNNVGKHARASTVWVTLNLESADTVVFTARDDGIGLDVTLLDQAARGGHVGLAQMRERVEGLGGTFSLQSQANKGTEIKVTLPLSRPYGLWGH